MAQTTSTQAYFCTYRNSETNREWRKSREYPTMAALLQAMTPYLEKHPWTSVNYQFRTVYSFEGQH